MVRSWFTMNIRIIAVLARAITLFQEPDNPSRRNYHILPDTPTSVSTIHKFYYYCCQVMNLGKGICYVYRPDACRKTVQEIPAPRTGFEILDRPKDASGKNERTSNKRNRRRKHVTRRPIFYAVACLLIPAFSRHISNCLGLG
jgi:hypothetical protein